jgi:hypothetical protein
MIIGKIRLLCIFGAIGVITYCGICLLRYDAGQYIAHRDMVRLLRGDGSVSIESIQFNGYRRILDDPESTQYVSHMFRSAEISRGGVGLAYYITIRLSTGSTVECALYIPTRKDRLTLLFPIDSLSKTGEEYLVILREPVPKALVLLLEELG